MLHSKHTTELYHVPAYNSYENVSMWRSMGQDRRVVENGGWGSTRQMWTYPATEMTLSMICTYITNAETVDKS